MLNVQKSYIKMDNSRPCSPGVWAKPTHPRPDTYPPPFVKNESITLLSFASSAIMQVKNAPKFDVFFTPSLPPNAIRTPSASTRTPASV